ncbi:MAG: hypothetical protein HRT93_07985 [Piscirickettsiaceae bacterium]|nr:hypothetical protein [Piscirickettsiaceae bacterium]
MNNINIFIAGILSGILNSAIASEVEFSGIASTEWSSNIDGGRNDALMISVLPEWIVRFDNGWKLNSILRLRGDFHDELYPSAIRRDGVSDASKSALLSDHIELELREFFIEGEFRDSYLTIGKQQIVWGKSDGLKVLDIVNPQSFNQFILDDYDDSRIPLWALNIEQTWGDWDLQFIWIPDKTYHALPKQEAPFAFRSPEIVPSAPPGIDVQLNDADRPDRFFTDSDAGIRASTFIGGWDLSFNYLYQYNNLSVLYQDITVSPSGPTVNINPEYERTHVIGGSFSNAFGDVVIRGEVGYFTDHYFISRNSVETKGIMDSPELSYVLGVDWTGIEDVFISGQLFQSWITDYDSSIVRDEVDTTLTFLYRQDFMYETLKVEMLVISNLNNGDGLVRPKISYEWSSELEAWIGFDIFYGKKEGLYGQFANNDRLILGAEISF